MTKEKEKNIILIVGMNLKMIDAVRDLEKVVGNKYRVAVIVDNQKEIKDTFKEKIDIIIHANLKNSLKIEDALLPYHDEIIAVNCVSENMMVAYQRIIPLFPYLKLPTIRSIKNANNKIEMRKALKKYAPKTIPRFMIVRDMTESTVEEIKKNVSFPCVVKPASLSKSQLVTTCYYDEELKKTLQDTFKKINALYKKNKVEQKPEILVEQLIEGSMYSVDAYVNSRGKVYFTPYIEIKTGKDIGHDDFFMYSQMVPSNLSDEEKQKANQVVEDGIHALGLRSSTAHVEMYRTRTGFKIVEIGARVGGYRKELLGNCCTIQHHVNDLLIKLGKAPNVKLGKMKHVVFLKFWPQQAGKLKSLQGFKKISKEPNVFDAKQNYKPGDKVGLSKNGFPAVCSLYIHAPSRSELLGHIRKVEKTIKIELE